MEFKEFMAIDKSISLILSLIVVYFLYNVIKSAPKWIEKIIKVLQDNAIATENNSKMMEKVQMVFSASQDMHEKMNHKIDGVKHKVDDVEGKIEQVQVEVDELKCLVLKNMEQGTEEKKELLDEIRKLEETLVELKKSSANRKEG